MLKWAFYPAERFCSSDRYYNCRIYFTVIEEIILYNYNRALISWFTAKRYDYLSMTAGQLPNTVKPALEVQRFVITRKHRVILRLETEIKLYKPAPGVRGG